jgi:hypothetical protein
MPFRAKGRGDKGGKGIQMANIYRRECRNNKGSSVIWLDLLPRRNRAGIRGEGKGKGISLAP